MTKLLQVDFEFNGPFGEEMTVALMDLAKSINQEPGMIWKIWTENAQQKLGGGIYLFETEATAKEYLAMHTVRLQQLGISQVRGVIFDINQPLTNINQGPTTDTFSY
ncbi:monooxygenase [Photobacterium andalusiense]|uniref:Putative monooxygenase YdhR n=1 Tax=Photobacterium andalusiense TaxID=2204296 RepID=A0A1Y6MBP7_9GAMM|nr:monooxygenase [Photobacterium andalusiense]SMY33974.1 Putative monooxygenase YdhR [Photobacterium andalusiense]